MLSFLPAPVIGVLNSLLLGLNTVFWCLLLYIPAVFKLVIPHKGFRVLCTRVIIWISESWVACNTGWMKLTTIPAGTWKAPTSSSARAGIWCSAIIESWVDILAWHRVFNRPWRRF